MNQQWGSGPQEPPPPTPRVKENAHTVGQLTRETVLSRRKERVRICTASHSRLRAELTKCLRRLCHTVCQGGGEGDAHQDAQVRGDRLPCHRGRRAVGLGGRPPGQNSTQGLSDVPFGTEHGSPLQLTTPVLSSQGSPQRYALELQLSIKYLPFVALASRLQWLSSALRVALDGPARFVMCECDLRMLISGDRRADTVALSCACTRGPPWRCSGAIGRTFSARTPRSWPRCSGSCVSRARHVLSSRPRPCPTFI